MNQILQLNAHIVGKFKHGEFSKQKMQQGKLNVFRYEI